jgi:DNA-3-methyladenine glycosylase
MKRILTKHDLISEDTPALARNLLGKFLVCEKNGKKIEKMITEVEAYHGHSDRASHAYKGKTPRTEIMFCEGGHWYVYLIYGMYFMANIVTGPEKFPAAILIRGVEKVSGPGKVAKYFGITKKFNTKEASPKSGLYIVDKGIKIPNKGIKKTPRMGVSYAGKYWAGKKYRFILTST